MEEQPEVIVLSRFFDCAKRNPPKTCKNLHTTVFQDFPNMSEAIATRRNVNWHPPVSPHGLIEENLYENPWALLVATIFLNKTACKAARPQLSKFLQDYTSPEAVIQSSLDELKTYFLPLGLQEKRALQVRRMSEDFLLKDWKDPRELYGIGSYGKDAFDLFCLGDLSRTPRDRFLRIYRAWYRQTIQNL